MDALSRFKSVLQRAQWADVPRHSVTVRSWPPAAPADDDEDWDAVIARAKMQAPLPRTPRPLQPPPVRHLPAELQVTPPPTLVRQTPTRAMAPKAPRPRAAQEVRARLDVVVWGSPNKPAVLRPAFAPRRTAEEDMVTPPPVK
jgi:hypothetical protein